MKMSTCLKCIILINIFLFIYCDENKLGTENNVISITSYVFWPNATIPFYINPDHFDHEQSLSIMTALSMFAFKSCIKFAPVMAPPEADHHVIVFVNPEGKRRCVIDTDGHSVFEPHVVTLGYECLQSPQIDMMIMKALGFPFEHNRASRDVFIEVLLENIEPGAINLFTKDPKLPLELRNLPYDIDSVLHFGNRDYSKNGHRTIIFKDHKIQQNRIGLSQTDLRKIEVVYGPECLKRDRQEKLELCQSYPGVARKKRSAETVRSLRVNPNITPPPENITQNLEDTLKELGIDEEVQEIVEHVYKVSALALKNAREKYCDKTKPDLRSGDISTFKKSSDILGIIEVVTDYAKSVVEDALKNLTEFCESSKSIEAYQRARCAYDDGSSRCRQTYRSTKSGPVRYSTQHRPVYYQSTNHEGRGYKYQFDKTYRSRNNSDDEIAADVTEDLKETTVRFAMDANNVTVKKIERKRRDLGIPVLEKVSEESKRRRKRHLEQDPVTDIRVDDSKVSVNKTNTSKSHVAPLIPDYKTKDKHELVLGNVTESTNSSSILLRMENTPSEKKSIKYADARRLHGRRSRGKNSKIRNLDVDLDDSNISIEKAKKRKKHVREMKEEQKIVEELDIDNEKSKKKQKRLIKKEHTVKREKARAFVPKTVPLTKLNREFYDERKWPGGVVRYMIEEGKNYDLDDMRKRLEEVNTILKKKTCVTLQEITEREANKYEDYIVLDTSPDYVTGRVGGKQPFGCVELFRGGQHRQHAAMMVMAMLGFYFELARHDRDRHVRVHMRHVRADKLHHFEKIREEATLPLPYDYKSATHPAWQFWRKIGKTGISTVATFKEQDADGQVMKSLGQNEQLLSDIDIIKINSVYGVKCFHNERSQIKEKKENVV